MDTIERIRHLIAQGDVRISEHGYDEMAEDGILAREIFAGVATAIVVEDYPNSERDHRFSYSRPIALVARCTWSGAFRAVTQGLRFW
jgi:hypothetical protein